MASNGRHTENLRKRLAAQKKLQTGISKYRAKNIGDGMKMQQTSRKLDEALAPIYKENRERARNFRNAARSRANQTTRK